MARTVLPHVVMRRLSQWSLVLLLSLAGFVGRASADWPAVVARDDATVIQGLPAISGDGRTIAVAEEWTSPSGASRVSVRFLGARTGRSMGEWLVVARDDEGRALAPPADTRGETPWRRARNLTLHFAARGFRPLVVLLASADGSAPGVVLEGAGLRLAQTAAEDEVVVTDAAGRARLRVGLPLMTSYCGMSDDAPTEAPPLVRDAHVDLLTRTLLLSYGHVYASCMCDDAITLDVLRLAR